MNAPGAWAGKSRPQRSQSGRISKAMKFTPSVLSLSKDRFSLLAPRWKKRTALRQAQGCGNWKLGRRFRHRVADRADRGLDLGGIVALGHDADHRLGARGADDQPAAAVERGLDLGDPGLHLGVFEGLPA